MMREKIAVIGLGYVGLPLAVAFGEKIETIGFDISDKKIAAYQKGHDANCQVDAVGFQMAKHLRFTSNPQDINQADYIIIAVPTPITNSNQPDLSLVISASILVGKHMKKGAVVVYESTVYPGVTEDICGHVLEEHSGMKCGVDFRLGYSPERINPGDNAHTLQKIVKVISAQDSDTLERLAALYGMIITAGVFKAESIRVAEAAKAIENTQRDLNIALMNELALIFQRIGIDTKKVLEAAQTKWNFLPFRPGLVGGHCIGVDPYYLTYCAQMAGYHPDVILAGRRINDSMGFYIGGRTVKELIHAGVQVQTARVLILGLTYKENCPDVRNTRVVDIIQELKEFGIEPVVYDPVASRSEARKEYGVTLNDELSGGFDAVVMAVAHKQFIEKGPEWIKSLLKPEGGVVVDVKSAFEAEAFNAVKLRYWRL